MIIVNEVSKLFDKALILDKLSISFEKGLVYGLVGSNGAGKSTLLRLITGIYRQNDGNITLDGQEIYDNEAIKQKIAFVPDDLYFLSQSNMKRMAEFYSASYPKFSFERFNQLTELFGLDSKKKISTFSKGMKRQAATILALSSGAEYIFLDETFDGLDPVMRNLVKQLIYSDVAEKGICVVITSHSLRELEDTCDRLALLHKGGIVLESDLDSLETSLVKVQAAFSSAKTEKEIRDELKESQLLNVSVRGSVVNLIVRGNAEKVEEDLRELRPLLIDILPLTLEEVFIYELAAKGYTYDELKIQGGEN